MGNCGPYSDPNYRYDANGNTTQTPRHALIAYSHDNQARFVDLGGGGKVRYVRHGDQRAIRFVNKTGVKAMRIHLGPWEYHDRDGDYRKAVLHIEGHGRHAQAETVISGTDSDSLGIFYVHGDHLGSGQVLTKDDATLLSQEEYFPYGRPSDRRDARNRYRFIGVERDEDTGLCLTGPRTYDPVCGRFLQGDPEPKAHQSVFLYASGTPLRSMDPSGFRDEEAAAQPTIAEAQARGVERLTGSGAPPTPLDSPEIADALPSTGQLPPGQAGYQLLEKVGVDRSWYEAGYGAGRQRPERVAPGTLGGASGQTDAAGNIKLESGAGPGTEIHEGAHAYLTLKGIPARLRRSIRSDLRSARATVGGMEMSAVKALRQMDRETRMKAYSEIIAYTIAGELDASAAYLEGVTFAQGYRLQQMRELRMARAGEGLDRARAGGWYVGMRDQSPFETVYRPSERTLRRIERHFGISELRTLP